MQQRNFSTVEQANQVAEQMQLAVFAKHGLIAQRAIYALSLIMVALVVWAAFAESDVCAEAVGRLEPRVRVQEIRPTADGTIAEYRVRDGQEVKKGDLLILLNTVRAEAELTKKEKELSILETQLKEHENSAAGLAKVIVAPQDMAKHGLPLPEAERLAGALFVSKKALDSANYDISAQGTDGSSRISPQMSVLQAEKQKLEAVRRSRTLSMRQKVDERTAERKKLESRIEVLQSSLQKARTELDEMEAVLADAKKEMEIYEKGRKLGVASEVKFLDVQNYIHQRQFLNAQQKLQIAELEQQLNAAKTNLSSSERAYKAEQADLGAGVKIEETKIASVPLEMNEAFRSLQFRQASFEVASYHARGHYAKELTEIGKLQREISAARTAAIVLRKLLDEKYLRAPVDGTVANLVHLLPGEIVVRGQPLVTVVPADKQMVLRAEVNNTDVGFVELGQEARLRVAAFPVEEFGIVKGKVIRVGDYPEEKVEGQKKLSVYRVTILPEQLFIGRGKKRFQLQSGLKVYADIVLRKRSLLALLFDPLLKMGNY